MLKASWIIWSIVTAFWMILLISGAGFLWLRDVDGTGAVQTPEIKLLSIGVWIAFLMIPFVLQILWLLINIVATQKQK
ncbi:DUF3923 domain-containing protein [Staphylococcus chromogenes]|uniref:DUF3923 domain-containing protein n=1 Tax=Staphylococcus chromogenes TaxID=46126 RepID=A0AAE5T369_STACR|nr:DUF3923 family protein [Staphylococcus chromogenes]KDP12571.1 hypothetical protein SCHR_07372 [Staphylococcus chromogenes MU 970]MBP0046306.1 DUF3923 family protein [Staphylococcus chromogenes]MBV5137791.1 DUF3923 family protein [Staphylococcus chromogenes]MBV5191511.1 DUF3923 family protein [Staphylococcus chromogenes]MBW3131859.1 DUF3923 family protein [Staphylococcus chromogenes]